MLRVRHLIWPLLLLSLLFTIPAHADGAVEMTVYSSVECSSCAIVKRQILDPLLETYGDRLMIKVVEVSEAEGLRELEELEARLGQPNNPLPVIMLNGELLADEDIFALEEQLTQRVEALMAAPPATTPSDSAPAPEAIATPVAADSTMTPGAAIHVAYVEKDGCSECARALLALHSIQPDYPGMVIHTFNDVRDADLLEAIGAHLGLPEARRLIAPSVFVGERALVDQEITTASLRALMDEHSLEGAPAFWEQLDTEAGTRSIVARFRRMGPLAVVLAGLIDGINPCAFATILFFVSYLAVSRRGRREMLAVGLAFTLGVFVTYLAVGMGALSVLKLLSAVRIVGIVLYAVMAAICLVLAVLSARDYVLARQGKLHDMTLNLPDGLRERIRARIRTASGAFVGAAFATGMLVSLLELACTGQVYLPTISFVASLPELRSSAFIYLLIYNLAFVLPLLVILVLAVYGVSAAKFEAWFVKNVARTKLIMALLFLLLGALLIVQLVTL